MKRLDGDLPTPSSPHRRGAADVVAAGPGATAGIEHSRAPEVAESSSGESRREADGTRVATRDEHGAERWTMVLILLALAVAALRLWKLGGPGLWIDEALTISDALHGGYFDNPIGYWLYEAWIDLLGHRPNEAELRLPSALFGVLTIPLCAFAFVPLVGRRAAWGAALLLAASSWHLYWSQTARFYTIAMALSLLGVGVLLRALLRDRWLLGLFGLVLAGSAALAHPTAILVLPGLVVGPLIWSSARVFGEQRLDAPASVRALLAVGCICALLGIGKAIGMVEHWRFAKGGATPVHLMLTSGFYFTPLLLAGALFGTLDLWRRRSRALPLAIAVVLLGVGSGFAAASLARMTAQYLFLLLPWVCLLAAAPTIPRTDQPERAWRTSHAMAWLGLLTMPSLATCMLYFTSRHGERPHWREAYEFVFNELAPGDLILGMAAPVGEYYLAPERTELREPERMEYLDNWRHHVPTMWDRTGRRTWFVVQTERLADWERERRAELERVVREDCRLVKSWPLFVEARDLSVYVYLRE